MDHAWAAWLVFAALMGPAEAATRRLLFGAASLGALAGAATAVADAQLWLQASCSQPWRRAPRRPDRCC